MIWRYVIVALFCLVAFAPGTAQLPPTDRDESRYMQASKQMVETGDYVDIRLQDQPRYRKPVAVYWMQAAALNLSGYGAEAPVWVYRAVSVVMGTVAVLALMWLATGLYGAQAGLLAALGLAGILMLGFEARIAKTDAALLAATLLAQAALARVYVAARSAAAVRPAHAWLFWAALGAGILIKGPLTPGVVVLTLAGLAVIDRFDMRWLKQLRPLRGVLLMLAIVLPWFVAISMISGLEFWRISVGTAFLSKVASGQESHGAPPGYYLLVYSAFMWPFAPLALRGGLNALNTLRTDPRSAFAFAWFVPFWIALELAPTKLPHYILPVYPALLMMMGAHLAGLPENTPPLKRWQDWLMRLTWFGFGLVTLALAAGVVALPWYFEQRLAPAAFGAAALLLLAAWLASGVRISAPLAVRIGAASLSAALAFGATTGAVMPSVERFWLSSRIVEAWDAVRPCPDTPLVSVGYAEPSLVFLAGTQTRLVDPQTAASALTQDPACTVVAVTEEARPAFIASLGGDEASLREIGKVEAFYYTKGRDIAVTFYAASQ